ncbi:hypothetical protein [Clostridium boliviensis]|nr:hypothetical protein [Clostridium boliviensis]
MGSYDEKIDNGIYMPSGYREFNFSQYIIKPDFCKASAIYMTIDSNNKQE